MADIDWNSGNRVPPITRPPASSAEPDWDSGERTLPEKPSALRRYVADPAISLLKGAIGVPEAAVGLADIATGGQAGKIAEDIGFRPKEAKALIDERLSPEQQAVNKELADTKGFFPTIGKALQNPSTIAHSVLESAPSTLAMGATGRILRPALMKAGVSEITAPVLGGAIGEGLQQTGQAAEESRQGNVDRLLTPKQSAAAIASGVIDTAIAFGGGALAQRLGIGDIQTMLASGKLSAGAVAKAGQVHGFAKRLVAGGISEGVFQELPQSAQERMWQNYADDKPIMDGVPEAAAMGMLTGAVMGAPSAAISTPEQAPAQPVAPAGTTTAAGPADGAQTAVQPPETAAAPGGETPAGTQVDSAGGTSVLGAEAAPAPKGPMAQAAEIATTTGLSQRHAEPFFPFTEQGAQRRAGFLNSQGQASRVTPHPEHEGRFAIIPDEYGAAKDDDSKIKALENEGNSLIERLPKGRLMPAVQTRIREIDAEIEKIKGDAAAVKEKAAKKEEQKAKEKAAKEKADAALKKEAEQAERQKQADLDKLAAESAVPKAKFDDMIAAKAGELDQQPTAMQLALKVAKEKAERKAKAAPAPRGRDTATPTVASAAPAQQQAPVEHASTALAHGATQPEAKPLAKAATALGNEVHALALQTQRDAGWDSTWPFIPADLQNADFRDLISKDPDLSDAEKTKIFAAGRKLGVVPSNEIPKNGAATAAPADAKKPAETTLAEPAKIGKQLATAVPLPKLRFLADKGGARVKAIAKVDELARRDQVAQQGKAAAKAREAEKNTPSRTFLRLVNELGGVKADAARDVSGEKSAIKLGGMAARIFRKDGHGIDYMATRLHEVGWLTDAEYQDVDGGVQRVRDMIRASIDGTLEPVTEDAVERAGEREMDERALAAEADALRPDNWDTMNDGQKDAELDALFGEDSRVAAEGAPAAAETRPPAVGQDLQLEAHTEAEVKAKEQRAADEKTAERERIKRESEAGAGAFNLAGDTKPASVANAEGAAKQGDLLAPANPMSAVADALRTAADSIEKAVAPKESATPAPALTAAPSQEDAVTPAAADEPKFSRSGLTDSAAFKDWFGDSKVVDEAGNPLVVYHGTNAVFTSFNPKRQSGGALGRGFYFAEDESVADSAGENVMPVYLGIKNPLTLSKLTDDQRAEWNDLFENDPVSAQERAIDEGYDGVLDDVYTDRQWVAFEPTQIKSAIGNNGDFDASNPDIRFKVEPAPNPGLSVSDIKSHLQPILARWKNAPKVEFHQTLEDPDVPKAIREATARKRSEGVKGRVQGVWYSGTAHLFADAIQSRDDATMVLFHEVLGHYGLNRTFGPKMQTILKQVSTMRFPEVSMKALQYGLNMESPGDRMTAAEEVLADMAQTRPEIGFVKRAIAAIREFLRSIGVKLELSDNDIIANFIVPAREFVEGGRSESESGKTGEPMFSLGGAGTLSALQSSPRVAGYVSGLLQSSGKLGMLNGINTQYHKALALEKKGFPGFKKVFDKTQDYLNDITATAVTAEQEAPGIFRELRGIGIGAIRKYFKGAATDAEIQSIQPALHVGTLFGGGNPMDGRKWSDEELKFGGAILPVGGSNMDKIATTFKKELKQMPAGEMRLPGLFEPLTEKGIALYKEARAAVDRSLEDQAKSLIYRNIRSTGITFDKGMNLADVAQTVQDGLDEAISASDLHISLLADQLNTDPSNERAKKVFDKAMGESSDLKELKKTVAAIEAKANKLIEHGYMPLQRFGNRVVTAKDKDGKTQFVGFYDGNPLVPKSADVEMNRAAMALRHENPTWTVTTERKSERAWELYSGLNLDALENFLDFLDPETKANLERDATIQEYMKNAVNSRSTLTRMVHRKGTAGFSTDIPRTLASFITSNARSASANYHGADMKSLVEDIKEGDIKDEAADLVKYILEPKEEAAKLRSFLFFHFLGGSIAAGLVNLSQTPMMTAPALLAHAGLGKVTSALGKAAKMAVQDPKTIAGKIGEALHKAEMEGLTAPQMVHHLTAVAANNPFTANRQFRTFMTFWGGMFSTTEVFNRRVAFLAAYDIAAADKTKGDPYEFAKGVVNDTQLLYNKANRPNLGRGALGATILTFKTFSIGYIELLRRLPPQQQLMMLGMLVLMAGAEGLPFAEDIEDLIDTLGQWLGFNTNTGKWLGKTVRDTLGPEFERPLLKGLGGMLPLDLHSRLGMGNLLPATAYFKQSEIDKTRDVAEAVGPLGGVLKNFSDSLQMLARGRWDKAAVNAAPAAVRNAYNGAHMLATGEAEDIKGRKTLGDVTLGEGLGKAIGFNPQRAAAESETKREIMQDRNLRTVRMDEIAGDWADGILRSDAEKIADARARLLQWNTDNPELRIMGPSLMRSISERVKAARMSGEQRFLKSVPKSMRESARQDLAR